MNRRRIIAVITKDLKEISANKMVIMPMIVVPAILCIIMPAAVTALALTNDVAAINGAELLERVIPRYTIPADITTLAAKITYVFLNYSFIPLFMLIPIMTSSIIAANSVVGEKERKTLETLLYTPLTNREFLLAKQLSAFIPAVLITALSFLGYFIVVNGISWGISGLLMVRSPLWIPTILLLTPSVSMVGLAVALLVSLRSKSFMEAQQMSALVVIPFVILVGIQVAGLVVFNLALVLAFTAVMIGIAYYLVYKVGPKFERERIVNTL